MKWSLSKRDKNDNNLSPLNSFRREIDSLFDNFLSGHSDSLLSSAFNPTVDIKEDDKAIYVEAEIPGLDEKNLDVQIENNVLTIKGEKKEEKENKDKNCHCVERRYGSFQRSFTLPAHVKADEAKAKYKKGVLKLEIPKDQAKAPKKLKVDVN